MHCKRVSTAVQIRCSILLQRRAWACAPRSVYRRLCALRVTRHILGLPDPTTDEDVNWAMRRLKRTKQGCPRQAKDMTRTHLEQCLAVQPDSS